MLSSKEGEVGKEEVGIGIKEEEGRGTLVCFAVVSSTITMAALACVGFFLPLLSLALVCPSRNTRQRRTVPVKI